MENSDSSVGGTEPECPLCGSERSEVSWQTGPGQEVCGTDDEPIAVEVETSPTDDVVQDKLERYVHGQPYRDMFLLDVGECPETFDAAVEWVQEQL